MTINELINVYEKYKTKFGNDASRHISQLFSEIKEKHHSDFLKSATAARAVARGRQPDHEQSWRAFKGKNLEKLILHIIKDEVETLGLGIVEGNKLERTTGANLPKHLSEVKRNLLVDFGQFGSHLPDIDLVIYNPETNNVIAVISSKVTLRERIAQTGYWKLKLSADDVTKHIKVFFVTPDEDGTLKYKSPPKKGRAIVETDTDGSYILTEENIEESDKVKTFDKFIADLKNLIY